MSNGIGVARLGQRQHLANTHPDLHPVRWWERCLLVGLALTLLTGMVLALACLADQPPAEIATSLRAGWAVRTDQNIYAVEDDHHRHYQSPPLLAILSSPLAQPPAGFQQAAFVPYTLAVLVWWGLAMVCLGLAVHWLAHASEATSLQGSTQAIQQRSRWWWYLRTLPLLFLAGPLAVTLALAQVPALLLFLIAGLLLSLKKDQRFQAGLWLAGAICVNVYTFPLLLLNIWRRDRFMTMGTVFGVFLGMLLIPGLVVGLPRTNEFNQAFAHLLQLPHGLPIQATLFMLGITCWFIGPRHNEDPVRRLHFVGALLAIILLATSSYPTQQSCLLLPLFMGILAEEQRRTKGNRPRIETLVGLSAASLLITASLVFREQVLLLQSGTTILWAMSCVMMYQTRPANVVHFDLDEADDHPLSRAA